MCNKYIYLYEREGAMRIDNSFGYVVDHGFDQLKIQDPFDLHITINELRNERGGVAPITSISLCTPGCTNGTGNSYCCTCR